jgi:hypothetical protein
VSPISELAPVSVTPETVNWNPPISTFEEYDTVAPVEVASTDKFVSPHKPASTQEPEQS